MKVGILGKSLWQKIDVNLRDKSFMLRIAGTKTLNICHGKLAQRQYKRYAYDFSIKDGEKGTFLVYEPTAGITVSFDQVVKAFKEMLDENT